MRVVAAVDVAGDGEYGDEVDGEARPCLTLKNAIHFLESAGLESARADERLPLPFLFESAEFCRLRRGRIKR